MLILTFSRVCAYPGPAPTSWTYLWVSYYVIHSAYRSSFLCFIDEVLTCIWKSTIVFLSNGGVLLILTSNVGIFDSLYRQLTYGTHRVFSSWSEPCSNMLWFTIFPWDRKRPNRNFSHSYQSRSERNELECFPILERFFFLITNYVRLSDCTMTVIYFSLDVTERMH